MATRPQLTKLAIIRSHRGITREKWFEWVEKEVGRSVKSNAELTVREAIHLIEVAEALARQGA